MLKYDDRSPRRQPARGRGKNREKRKHRSFYQRLKTSYGWSKEEGVDIPILITYIGIVVLVLTGIGVGIYFAFFHGGKKTVEQVLPEEDLDPEGADPTSNSKKAKENKYNDPVDRSRLPASSFCGSTAIPIMFTVGALAGIAGANTKKVLTAEKEGIGDKAAAIFATKKQGSLGITSILSWLLGVIALIGLCHLGTSQTEAEGAGYCSCQKWCGRCILLMTGIFLSFGFVYVTAEIFHPAGFEMDVVVPEYCSPSAIAAGSMGGMGRIAACTPVVRSRTVLTWNSTMNYIHIWISDTLQKIPGIGYAVNGLFNCIPVELFIRWGIKIPMGLVLAPLAWTEGQGKALKGAAAMVGIDSAKYDELETQEFERWSSDWWKQKLQRWSPYLLCIVCMFGMALVLPYAWKCLGCR